MRLFGRHRPLIFARKIENNRLRIGRTNRIKWSHEHRPSVQQFNPRRRRGKHGRDFNQTRALRRSVHSTARAHSFHQHQRSRRHVALVRIGAQTPHRALSLQRVRLLHCARFVCVIEVVVWVFPADSGCDNEAVLHDDGDQGQMAFWVVQRERSDPQVQQCGPNVRSTLRGQQALVAAIEQSTTLRSMQRAVCALALGVAVECHFARTATCNGVDQRAAVRAEGDE